MTTRAAKQTLDSWLRRTHYAAMVAAVAVLGLSCGGSPEVTRSEGVRHSPIGTPGAEPPRYIITIASDAYEFKGYPRLKRAEQDASAIERAFRDRLGFATRDDLRLRGDAATTDAILHLIGDEGPLRGLPRDALAVVYIALHGRTRNCAAPDVDGETQRPRRCGHLVTRDAERSSQTIELTTLLDLLAKHGPHHTIVLIDVCNGGLALGVPVNALDYATVLRSARAGSNLLTARGPGERRSRKVLTSVGATELADDGGAMRPSVFAEAILQGLEGAADLYADGLLLFPELALYVHAEVHRLSNGSQEPESGGFYDDGRGAPVLGVLQLAGSDGETDADALLMEARALVDRGEIHGAIWFLRRAVAAQAGRALAEQQALREAEALAAAGQSAAAIDLLEAVPSSTRGSASLAFAVRRQVQARIARQGRHPAAEVARLEARAVQAGLTAMRAATSTWGQARLVTDLGALAMVIGTPHVAGMLATEARAAIGVSVEPHLIEALAANEIVALTAAREDGQSNASTRDGGAVRESAPEPTTGRPPDRDGDGIPDAIDLCADHPEDFDGIEDANGCPEDDADADGIADAVDKCPLRKEIVNQFEDDDGCPDEVPSMPNCERFEFNDVIYFDSGKYTIQRRNLPILDRIAEALQENSHVKKLRIEGHTDSVGSDAANMTLSRNQAKEVLEYLVRKGVSRSRLTAVGYGETRPVASNEDDIGRAQNRRVDFIIIDSVASHTDCR